MAAPNLDRLSQAFSIVSEECPKFNNIPAFNQGADILNALTRLTDRVEGLAGQFEGLAGRVGGFENALARLTDRVEGLQDQQTQMQRQIQQTQMQMQQMQTQMEDRWQRIDQRFDSLETRIMALNLNSAARTQNSMVAFVDRQLSPLVNAGTSENIPEFPETPAALSRMSSANINRVLLALGLSTTGGLETRRDTLRVAVGMKVGGV
ncbi:hypothetical protein EAF04_009633 [Stromatinia cepivora]|nr:hypothetical protein EAF04_009633 [Stromatinia cepivora]